MFCSACQAFWQAVFANSTTDPSSGPGQNVQWSQTEVVLHRSVRTLKHSSDLRCPICRTILYTPTTYERNDLFGNDNEELDIVLELKPEKALPILSVLIYKADGHGKAPLLPRRIVAAGSGALLDDDLASTLGRCLREGNASTGSDAAFELAAFWLNQCLTSHEGCHAASTVSNPLFVPTRLLDVGNGALRLVETKNAFTDGSCDRRYLALSHCWGKIAIIRTLTENYGAHLETIDHGKLSKTFSDAVYATQKLGFRYLWIDSLCIVQDDSDDWTAEAVTMCDVYMNATLTIAAAHAPGGDVGCFHERDGLLQLPFTIDVPNGPFQDEGSTKAHRVLFTSYGRGEGLNRPEPPLYGRAWVTQEQLLSRRMLIFDGSQIRWECNSSHGSERSPMGGMSRHVGHQKTLRLGICNDVEFFDLPQYEDKGFAVRAQIQSWCYEVMDYTHRGMTKSLDRLVAIDGVAQALKRHTSHQYYAGLWGVDVFVGLLWSISHRAEFTNTTRNAFDVDGNKHVRHEKEVAPSWSWASVTVPIVYPVPTIMYLDRICEIRDILTTGTPARQTGRLTIRGHTRTGYVDAIYPYAMREAAQAIPHMVMPKPDGRVVSLTYRGRAFHPNDLFIFSDSKPPGPLTPSALQPWRFVRGTFRPDELIDPSTQLTFLAIAQQHAGEKAASVVATHTESDPLMVFSLALVSTGLAEGSYRRVGYAVWEDCAWYGHMCGRRGRPGREVTRAEGWRGMTAVGNLEQLGWRKVLGGKGHGHSYDEGGLPGREKYCADVGWEEKVVVIV